MMTEYIDLVISLLEDYKLVGILVGAVFIFFLLFWDFWYMVRLLVVLVLVGFAIFLVFKLGKKATTNPKEDLLKLSQPVKMNRQMRTWSCSDTISSRSVV